MSDRYRVLDQGGAVMFEGDVRQLDDSDRTFIERAVGIESSGSIKTYWIRCYEATVQHLEQQLAEAREEIERLRGGEGE